VLVILETKDFIFCLKTSKKEGKEERKYNEKRKHFSGTGFL
jgi:hypothetical protein